MKELMVTVDKNSERKQGLLPGEPMEIDSSVYHVLRA